MNLKKIADAKISREEMFKDYEDVGSAYTLAEKKAIAEKYGIDSRKIADIQRGILEKMREERSTRSSFDKEDVKAFGRLSDYPEQYKKLAQYLAQESRPFVEFLADYYYKFLEQKGLTKKFNVENPATRTSYGMSYADMAAINRYANTKKFLKESTDEFKSAKAEHEDLIGSIKVKLDKELVDFKKLYIDKTVEYAGKVYSVAEKNIDKYLEKYHEFFEKAKEIEKRLYSEGKRFREVENDSELKGCKENRDGFWKAYVDAKEILSYSKDEYLKMAERDAISIYERNVNVLAEKINKWNVDVDAMTVTRVADDPKYFEIMVTDGTHKLYARSIWAAEYSDKVTPHFRFIITERK